MPQIRQTLLKFRTKYFRALVKARILNGHCRRNRKRLGETQMLPGKCLRADVTERQKAKHALRRYERNTQPGKQMGEAADSRPPWFLTCIREQEAVLRF